VQLTAQLAAKNHAASLASLASRRKRLYNSSIYYAGNARRAYCASRWAVAI
jgi:hypothetical protein